MSALLSEVEALKKSPLPEVRQTIAEKVSQYFNDGAFHDQEVDIACDIIRLLANDVEIRVRAALSECLKSNPKLPHDIALCMANDEAEVAIPVIEFSSVLTEGDILQIIRSSNEIAKLVAITRRREVSEPVSSALVHSRNDEVVVSLFANKKAVISEESLTVALEEFKSNGNVVDKMLDRGELPIGIVEKMINLTTRGIQERLKKRYDIDGDSTEDLLIAAREKATLGLLHKMNDNDMQLSEASRIVTEENRKLELQTEQLVKHLKSEGRLTSSIVLRSLCEGNFQFFEISMAVLAGIPVINARALVRSNDLAALKSLFQKANFPLSPLEAVNIIVNFAVQEDATKSEFTQETKSRLIEHIVSNGYDKTTPLMPYIIALISSNVKVDDVIN